MVKRYLKTPIMHRAVEANGFVFFGGITADDRTAGMKGQTEEILAKLEKYLAEAGTDKTKIVTATCYVMDLGMKDEMNAAWVEWFGAENLPSRATLGVSELGKGALLEVVVTAVK
ncbi:RidA family protein [Telmatospirillum sp. J64-1]|uniref:RidA family protein n=1 Tax=Telmatospirillum sp. J64-1 TaxID=2502183 RepID=UPI00115D7B8F|nr:RidA family protein [Telmatospirillum sp. J64-1]